MAEVLKKYKSESGSESNELTINSFHNKPLLYLNRQFQITECNEEFLAFTGLSKSEIIGSEPGLHFQNKLFAQAAGRAVKDGISSFRGVVQLGDKLESYYLEVVFFRNENTKDSSKATICCILDSNRQNIPYGTDNLGPGLFKDISRFLNAAVSVHDVAGKIFYISPSTEALLGYTEAELKELPDLYVVYPEDIHVVKDAVELLRNGRESLTSEYRMVHKDGSVISVQTSSYIVEGLGVNNKYIINVSWDLSSYSEMQRALKLSEQKYYRLAMNLPTGVSLISCTGKLIEANDTMRKIMGIAPDVPLPQFNFFDHEVLTHAGISDQFKQCIDSKEVVSGEMPFRSARTQEDMFLIYSFLPILNHKEEVETVIGYVSDLTEQKKAESESRERAEFLNLVINAIKSPFFVKNEDHRWVMLNEAAVEMMGSSRVDLLGKSDYDLYPKEQADIFWKYDELVFEQGSSINEEQITWSDGTIHDIVTHKQRYIEKPSGRQFIVGTIHDISNYKKIEQELRASETKYRELFDNANDFIITTDLDGNITNANRTLINHLQTDLEIITRLNVFEFVSKENDDFLLGLKQNILNGLADNSFEVNALTLDGAPVTYEVKASLIIENDYAVGIQCVFSDVTERKESRVKLEKYNKDLVELNKTKDKFFSIIAHDLRNPYSSMIGFSELLLEDLEKLTLDEIRDYLKIIRNSAKNSLNLLENLLAWSRLETGRMPFDPAKTNLNSIIEEVVNVLFSLAYRKKIEINNRVDQNVLLLADKNMLNTILNNLIMNAIKFTPIGGEITIFTDEPKRESNSDILFVAISVADTGLGMEPEVVDTLFTSKRPASNPGTEKEQGTGLGLVLSREMVEKHGGTIQVKSTPGKGTVFSFTIPLYEAEASIS